MLILALDTATKTASVALVKAGKPLGEITLNVGLTHSVSLLPALHELLKLTNLSLDLIDALAYASGPGSFTGLRIGGATISGLAQAKNLPIYAVPTLDAFACNGLQHGGLIAPILDARKNEFYTATYRNENGYINKIEEAKAISPEAFYDSFEKPTEVLVVGDAVLQYKEMLRDHGFVVASELFMYSKASNVGYLAYEKAVRGEKALSYHEIKPFYLRASEAETRLVEKMREKHV